jgi:hypothetical protein
MSILPNQSGANLSKNFWTRENRNTATGEISTLEVLENGLEILNVPILQTTTQIYNENFTALTDGKYVVIGTITVSNATNTSQTYSLEIRDSERSGSAINSITFTNFSNVGEFRTITTMLSLTVEGGDNVNLVMNIATPNIGATYSLPTIQCIFSPTG